MYTVKVEKEMTIENAINTFKCQLTYSMKSVKRCTYKEKPLKHQNIFITLADIALDGINAYFHFQHQRAWAKETL